MKDSLRLLDIVASSIGLVLLSPVFFVIAGCIRLDSRGPVFYLANRIGKDGRPFRLYKFRTMVINADKVGPAITVADDARVTFVGRLLREYKLDELPQLINVFLGHMSLVGPRPEVPEYVTHYTDEQRRLLSVRPGMTSAASIRFSDESTLLQGDDWEQIYLKQVLPEKLAIDLAYLNERSWSRDVGLIMQTVCKLAGWRCVNAKN